MEKRLEWAADGLHVFALCSFAIVQPLFAVLSEGPAFFVAHHAQPSDIYLLVLFLCGALPASIVLVEALVGLLSRAARRHLHFWVVTLLLILGLLPMLKRVEGIPGMACLVGAAVLGVTGGAAYYRFRLVRTCFTGLAPAVIVVPGLFMFHSPVSKIVLAGDYANAEKKIAKVENPVPVILVILDEFPTVSLMDEKREIDPIRYPHFAALVREATWFRNFTTVYPATTGAIPSILTGKYPENPGGPQTPTIGEYPDNLFTLLAGTYQVYSFVSCTSLCPARLNQVSAESRLSQRMRNMASDIGVIYGHIFAPGDLIPEDFPEMTGKWADFRGDAARRARIISSRHFLQKKLASLVWSDPPVFFQTFIETLQPAAEPRLYVVHCRLPHCPFQYLPSARRYSRPEQHWAGLLEDGAKWIDDERAVAREYQRHLLQVGCTDTMIGRLVEHLKQVGLYDDALLVITADHGVCHRPGEYRRGLTATNLEDITPVPLLIKVPGQKQGLISDRNVESIDVLPTVAHVLGVEIPWRVDGGNALDPSLPERPRKIVYQHGLARHPEFGEPRGRIVVDAAFERKYVALRRKLKLFGTGADPYGLYRLGPHGELVGCPVERLELVGTAEAKVELEDEAARKDYDPVGEFVPARIRGRVQSSQDLDVPIDLAVAVNGVIRGVAEVRETTDGVGPWSTIVAEESFRPGSNDVQVYVVSQTTGNLTLRRLLNSEAAGLASGPRQPTAAK